MTEALPDDDGRIRFDAAAPARRWSTGKTAVVIGPGIGTHDGAARTRALAARRDATLPLVLDADALTILARDPAPLRAAAGPHGADAASGRDGPPARRRHRDGAGRPRRRRAPLRRRARAARWCSRARARSSPTPDGFVWINSDRQPGHGVGRHGRRPRRASSAACWRRACRRPRRRCLGVYVHGLAADRAAADGEIGLLASATVADELRPAHRLRCCGEPRWLTRSSCVTASEEETRAVGRRLGRRAARRRAHRPVRRARGRQDLLRARPRRGPRDPARAGAQPSFPILLPYEGGRLPLYHIDLFRLPAGDIDSLALREYIYGVRRLRHRVVRASRRAAAATTSRSRSSSSGPDERRLVAAATRRRI